MKVVIQGNRLDLDISHVELDEEREVAIVPIMEDAITLELTTQDVYDIGVLISQGWIEGLVEGSV